MRYNFVKRMYSLWNEKDNKTIQTKEFVDKMDALVEKLNENQIIQRLNMSLKCNQKITKKFYMDMLKDFEVLEEYCIDKEGNFKREDSPLVQTLIVHSSKGREKVDYAECVFSYFLVTEGKLYKEELFCEETKNYEKRKYVDIYDEIFSAAGYSVDRSVFPCMEDYILEYILKTDQGLDDLIDLLQSWEDFEAKEESENQIENEDEAEKENKECDESIYDLRQIRNRNKLTYEQWEEIVKRGKVNSDVEAETLQSTLILADYLDSIVKDKELLITKDVEKIFGPQIIQVLRNTEVRRTWYVFDELFRIIKKQYKEIKAVVKNYRGTGEDQRKVRKVFRECWLTKSKNDALEGIKGWGNVAADTGNSMKYIKAVGEDVFEEALRKSFITVPTIAHVFDYYFEAGDDYQSFNRIIEEVRKFKAAEAKTVVNNRSKEHKENKEKEESKESKKAVVKEKKVVAEVKLYTSQRVGNLKGLSNEEREIYRQSIQRSDKVYLEEEEYSEKYGYAFAPYQVRDAIHRETNLPKKNVIYPESKFFVWKCKKLIVAELISASALQDYRLRLEDRILKEWKGISQAKEKSQMLAERLLEGATEPIIERMSYTDSEITLSGKLEDTVVAIEKEMKQILDDITEEEYQIYEMSKLKHCSMLEDIGQALIKKWVDEVAGNISMEICRIIEEKHSVIERIITKQMQEEDAKDQDMNFETKYRIANFRGTEDLFKKILSGKTRVSREMILLTILLAKAWGVEGITYKNVEENVLFNARFVQEIDEDFTFDKYFKEAFDILDLNKLTSKDARINRLQKIMEKMEAIYMYGSMDYKFADHIQQKKDGIAVFHTIMGGKEVE